MLDTITKNKKNWQRGSVAIIALEILGIASLVVFSSYVISDWQVKNQEEKQLQVEETINQNLQSVKEGNLDNMVYSVSGTSLGSCGTAKSFDNGNIAYGSILRRIQQTLSLLISTMTLQQIICASFTDRE